MEKRASVDVMLEMLLHLRSENAYLAAENRRLVRERALLEARFGSVDSLPAPAPAAASHGDGLADHLTYAG